jgi:hypothetical protein
MGTVLIAGSQVSVDFQQLHKQAAAQQAAATNVINA